MSKNLSVVIISKVRFVKKLTEERVFKMGNADGTWEVPGITHWDGCGDTGRSEHGGCPTSTKSSESDAPLTNLTGDAVPSGLCLHAEVTCPKCGVLLGSSVGIDVPAQPSGGLDLTEEESGAFWEALHPTVDPPPDRQILTELISEIRNLLWEPYQHRSSVELAYRREAIEDLLSWAEARLGEVSGNE